MNIMQIEPAGTDGMHKFNLKVNIINFLFSANFLHFLCVYIFYLACLFTHRVALSGDGTKKIQQNSVFHFRQQRATYLVNGTLDCAPLLPLSPSPSWTLTTTFLLFLLTPTWLRYMKICWMVFPSTFGQKRCEFLI